MLFLLLTRTSGLLILRLLTLPRTLKPIQKMVPLLVPILVPIFGPLGLTTLLWRSKSSEKCSEEDSCAAVPCSFHVLVAGFSVSLLIACLFSNSSFVPLPPCFLAPIFKIHWKLVKNQLIFTWISMLPPASKLFQMPGSYVTRAFI